MATSVALMPVMCVTTTPAADLIAPIRNAGTMAVAAVAASVITLHPLSASTNILYNYAVLKGHA